MEASTHIDHMDALPRSLFQRLRAQPERAPELLALAAAERFAPQAERWVQVAGAGHDAASLAKVAHRKHVRLARVEGLTLGIGGVVTSGLDLAALAWIQARMVFYIAAAHGYDPRHPMRPAELLALWEVYPTPAAAREGLDGVGKSMAQSLVEQKLSKGKDQALADKLLRYAGRQVAKRTAKRLIPFVSAPVASVQNGGATKVLGARAIAYYGGGGASPAETDARPD